jgi:hypothetical protein
MDGTRLQSLIYKGQAHGAAKAGLPYQVFRPYSAFDPLSAEPIVTGLPALFGANPKFSTFNSFGKAIWYGYWDGTQTQQLDLLVGDRTFYVAAQQPLAPILVVEAPRLVDIRVPFQQTGAGFQKTYGGNTAAQETVIMQGWPASILQGTKGENTFVTLPDDIRAPWWGILMPAFPDVKLESSFIVQDDLGRRFTISSAELTDMGWRITALQAQA